MKAGALSRFILKDVPLFGFVLLLLASLFFSCEPVRKKFYCKSGLTCEPPPPRASRRDCA